MTESKSTKQRSATAQDQWAQWISAEITLQLRELKEQLNKEITADMNTMRTQIVADLSKEIDYKLGRAAEKITRTSQSMGVLVKTDDASRDVIGIGRELALTEKIEAKVYDRVVNEINTNIVPKIDNMVSWVNYNMQDGGEVVDQYRRAFEKQVNNHDTKLITDGKKDKRIITPHVRTFFEDDSSDD